MPPGVLEHGGRLATDPADSPGDLERLIAAEAQIAARTAKAVSEVRALIALARVRVEESEGWLMRRRR